MKSKSNWMFALVAGVSILTAACQPYDVDDTTVVKPPRPEASMDRESRRLDEKIARHQARWKSLKQQYASN